MNIIDKRFYLWGRVQALIDLSQGVEINFQHFQFLIDEIDAYWKESDESSADSTIDRLLREERKKRRSLKYRHKDIEEEMRQNQVDLEDDYAESLYDDSDFDPYANYSEADLFRDAFDEDIDAWNHWNQ
jgi:conjugal transfer/entry exclusion protein